MQNKSPYFMTIASEDYFVPLKVSVDQVRELYPSSKLYIYDTGLTQKQVALLEEESHVSIVPWKLQFVDVEPDINSLKFFKKLFNVSRFRDIAHNIFKKHKIFFPENIYGFLKFEIKIYNNFLITKDFNERIKDRFIFIDADAFLIDKLDELLDGSFDVGLTVRRKEEFSYDYNGCRILNGGILFFLGEYEKNKAFIDAWEDELKITRETINIQTSIVRMLEREREGIWEIMNAVYDVTLRGVELKIKMLPCERYNFNWIEEFDAEKHKGEVKILHFKSQRFRTPLFRKIMHDLKLSHE